MDVRLTEAVRGYSATKSELHPDPGAPENLINKGVRDFAETLAHSETVAQKAMIGTADPHALVEALASSQLAVETTIAVRDRVVEAYQEILRMPV